MAHRRNPIKVIRNKRKGRVVARFKVRAHRAKKTPSHLRKYLFKKGTARLARALAKARRGWAAWRRRQLAKRR